MRAHHKRGKLWILGGGIGGMASAAALHQFYSEVHLFEADPEIGSLSARKGLPQAPHIHNLMLGAYRLLESLFPGIEDEILARGGARLDWNADFVRITPEGEGVRRPSNKTMATCSRPLLDDLVWTRVRQLPNVTFHLNERASLLMPSTAEAANRIGAKGEFKIGPSDLVIDASGWAAVARATVTKLGYNIPCEVAGTRDMVYYTQCTRLVQAAHGVLVAIGLPSKTGLLGTMILPVENGQVQLSVVGYENELAPLAPLEHVAQVDNPAVAAYLRAIEQPNKPAARFRCPPSRVWRLEKAAAWPQNVAVIGPAHGYTVPVLGLGIAVTLEAVAELVNMHESGAQIDVQEFHARRSRSIRKDLVLARDFDAIFGGGPKGGMLARARRLAINRLMRATAKSAGANDLYLVLRNRLPESRKLSTLLRAFGAAVLHGSR